MPYFGLAGGCRDGRNFSIIVSVFVNLYDTAYVFPAWKHLRTGIRNGDKTAHKNNKRNKSNYETSIIEISGSRPMFSGIGTDDERPGDRFSPHRSAQRILGL